MDNRKIKAIVLNTNITPDVLYFCATKDYAELQKTMQSELAGGQHSICLRVLQEGGGGQQNLLAVLYFCAQTTMQ